MNGFRGYMAVAMTAALAVLGWLLIEILGIHDATIMLHDDFTAAQSDIMQNAVRLNDHESRIRSLEAKR